MNPVAVNSVDVFTDNKRNVTYLHSDRCGMVAYVTGEARPPVTLGRRAPRMA